MKIGVIGWGVVGSACGEGFRMLGHEVRAHDPKLKTKLEEVIDTEIVFVCVPTPSGPDGECDLSIVTYYHCRIKTTWILWCDCIEVNICTRYYSTTN